VTSPRIREAVPDDARAVAEVHVEGWRWGYRNLLPAEAIAAQTVDDRLAQWVEVFGGDGPGREICLVADVDAAIVGFVSFGPATPEESEPPPHAAEVYAIYLREAVHGTGIGRALLESAVERLRREGYPSAVLWVLASNERARRFYEKAGWDHDGVTAAHRFVSGDEPIVRYAVEL
jgi:ribosomal protein S18 acetylase RimI-like enzyme